MPRDDYIFGVFSCESQSFVLRCASEEVVLPRRLFELLIFLVRQAGRIVTKEDLMESLWPEQMVTDNSLSKAVSDLRRILKRYSGEEYIRTVPAIGYQFLAPVDRKSIGAMIESKSASPGSKKAFEAYSKARYFWRMRTVEGLRRAAHFASQTVAFDPKYANAYVVLANCYSGLIAHGEGVPVDLLRRARQATEDALSIDPNLADAYVALANLNVRFETDWISAEANYRRAIELRPGNALALHWYGNALLAAGDVAGALDIVERAFLIEPYSISIRTARAQAYYMAGRYSECQEQLCDILEMSPRSTMALFGQAMVLGTLGDRERSIATFRRAVQLSHHAPFFLSSLGYACVEWGGDRREAARLLVQLQALSGTRYVPAYDIAVLQGRLGHLERAAASLRVAHENRDALLMWLAVDPRLRELRETGRLDDILGTFRLADSASPRVAAL